MEEYFPTNLTIKDATEMQEDLAQEITLRDDIPFDLKTIGGAALYSRGDLVMSSIAILRTNSFKSFKVEEQSVITEKVSFPAIPSFEGFREGKVLADTILRFKNPDIFMIEGHGINHPRKFGLASHVGLALDLPTIGVSKDILSGKVEVKDSTQFIIENGELRGAVVRKKPNSVPLYVSPGYKISLDTSVDLVKRSMKGAFPEPLKVARENLLKKFKSDKSK